ncbi:MAG TPA: hypothetical protein VFT53_02080 [Candidatus Saccharimonadales bacterium]|nr:hypothetical protein [Candidatus Saccharimonadales bacterium]
MNYNTASGRPYETPPTGMPYLPDPSEVIKSYVTSLGFRDYLVQQTGRDAGGTIPYDEYWRSVAEFSGLKTQAAIREHSNPGQAAAGWITAAAPYYYEAQQQLAQYRRQGDVPAGELHDFTVRYRQFLSMTLASMPDIAMAKVANHLVAAIVEAKGSKVAASPYYLERDMDRLVNGIRHRTAYGQIARRVRSYTFEQATLDDAHYGIDFWARPQDDGDSIPYLGLTVVPSLKEYRSRSGVPESVVYEDDTALVTSEGVAIVESLVYDTTFQGKCRLEDDVAERLAPQLALQVGRLIFRSGA